jgi:hypothetical protein
MAVKFQQKPKKVRGKCTCMVLRCSVNRAVEVHPLRPGNRARRLTAWWDLSLLQVDLSPKACEAYDDVIVTWTPSEARANVTGPLHESVFFCSHLVRASIRAVAAAFVDSCPHAAKSSSPRVVRT